MNIAFCINKLALIGLGVTVTSLIRNCSKPNDLNLWFICADLSNDDKKNIQILLEQESFSGKTKFVDVDPVKEFGKFKSLHGDWTTYCRLLLPDILSIENSVLYLDADLVVNIDVLGLEEVDIQDFGIAAVYGARLEFSIERDFLVREFGLSYESKYFNAGVLLMNLKYWRENKIKELCYEIANKHPQELSAVDQTILNAIFSTNFLELPEKYNCGWFANKPLPIEGDAVLHYVGSPKPWDVMGRYIHNGHTEWKKHLTPFWAKKYSHITLKDLIRAWKIRRSFGRLFRSKIKNALAR